MIDIGARTYVMGVVNVTPDSFSDGGKYFDAGLAIAHGKLLAAQGADLLDVGGESTRSGAEAVSEEEEVRRVVPVIEGLRDLGVPISVDTSKAAVAFMALTAGATIVNDVTALGDPAMAKVVARANAWLCLMHMQGTPRTMQADPKYADVVADVRGALGAAADRAKAGGVDAGKIWVDPGIGFGKTVDHNLTLLRRLNELRALGYPVLVGTSRKSFLGKVTGREAPQRVVASAATVALVAAAGSADIVRVHDVAESLDAARVGDAVRFGYRPPA